MKTFEDVKRESVPQFKMFIEEINEKLQYTNKTVNRQRLEKQKMFWQSLIDESNGVENYFFEKYPGWINLFKDRGMNGRNR